MVPTKHPFLQIVDTDYFSQDLYQRYSKEHGFYSLFFDLKEDHGEGRGNFLDHLDDATASHILVDLSSVELMGTSMVADIRDVCLRAKRKIGTLFVTNGSSKSIKAARYSMDRGLMSISSRIAIVKNKGIHSESYFKRWTDSEERAQIIGKKSMEIMFPSLFDATMAYLEDSVHAFGFVKMKSVADQGNLNAFLNSGRAAVKPFVDTLPKKSIIFMDGCGGSGKTTVASMVIEAIIAE